VPPPAGPVGPAALKPPAPPAPGHGRSGPTGTGPKGPRAEAPGQPVVNEVAERRVGRAATLLLAGVALVMLGALPTFFFIRDAVRDPVFVELDQLAVPSWAALAHQDSESGSRYCIQTCRLRERDWQSARATAETDAAYQTALRRAGWQPATAPGCPKVSEGRYSCWQRDQFVLDLYTRDANCTTSLADGPSLGPSAAVPSDAVNGAPPTGPVPRPTGPISAACPVSQVSAKVGDQVDPHWHH
ncbi:MAG: hypothetical protein J2P15_14100, partial [Micromonosporaceae bacterium]|nr:hypothetical protein [Micromonosporaceae bacterium]